MKYQPKARSVDAVQLVDDIKYHTGGDGRFDYGHDKFIAQKGDWLVIDGNEQYFLKDAEFRKLYQVGSGYDRS